MKNILKVTILFCLIITCFIVPSFAFDENLKSINEPAILRADLIPLYLSNQPIPSYYPDPGYLYSAGEVTSGGTNYRVVVVGDSSNEYFVVLVGDTVYFISENSSNDTLWVNYSGGSGGSFSSASFSSEYSLYYKAGGKSLIQNNFEIIYLPIYSDLDDALSYIDGVLNPTPTPSYNKNPNVDEFIANTLISMGFTFSSPSDALRLAADVWDYCINESSQIEYPTYTWNIDTFVSYVNAQSNNYLDWYNGYKVHSEVVNALRSAINKVLLDENGQVVAGVLDYNHDYSPFKRTPAATTFYAAQTITYFNGQFLEQNNNINSLQFSYTPPDVRRFLGYPATGNIVIPSDPEAGTGTITDDPNNPDQKNIEINFPSLDWLADAINSILDFLRNALTTLADLLTQLLDAILGLFSDAFSSLADFGQGIIDFMQSVFAGFSTLLNGYVPSDLAVIIACFIALNFGIGLITFILKGH